MFKLDFASTQTVATKVFVHTLCGSINTEDAFLWFKLFHYSSWIMDTCNHWNSGPPTQNFSVEGFWIWFPYSGMRIILLRWKTVIWNICIMYTFQVWGSHAWQNCYMKHLYNVHFPSLRILCMTELYMKYLYNVHFPSPRIPCMTKLLYETFV